MDSLRACGESVPTPLSERGYSGTFVVRTSPELHGRLAVEARRATGFDGSVGCSEAQRARPERRPRALRVRLGLDGWKPGRSPKRAVVGDGECGCSC
nr:toxin-antitoxin system HicB family antitoxin [Mycobacterium sp. IS-1264]